MIDKKNLVLKVNEFNIDPIAKALIILCGFELRKSIIIEDAGINSDIDFIMENLRLLGFIGLYLNDEILLAVNQKNLNSLYDAIKENNYKKLGTALGYPKDAVENFKINNGYTRFKKFLKIKYNNPDDISDEILIMNYIPRIFDNNISDECIKQSLKELQFLRQVCPGILNNLLNTKKIYLAREFSKF